MAKQKHFVQTRYSYHREYRAGNANGIAEDLERQVRERAKLLDRMRERVYKDEKREQAAELTDIVLAVIAILYIIAGGFIVLFWSY